MRRGFQHGIFIAAVLAGLHGGSTPVMACPGIATYRVEFPASPDLCETGTWSPLPTGIDRLLAPVPEGAQIVNARLRATFVTNENCNPQFNAGNLAFLIARGDGVEWRVRADLDLGWSGQGVFNTVIESSVLNGEAPFGFWHDVYFASVATQVAGHFHHEVEMPDAFWEVEYIDPFAIDGDVNCDGRINYEDIPAFVTAVVNADAFDDLYPECSYLRADMDCDEAADARDLGPFVELLLNAPLVGRCCWNDGACDEILEGECDAGGGVFGGIWSACDGNCPPSNPAVTGVSFELSPATNCDGDTSNAGPLEIQGDGFHEEVFVEFTQAGQPNVPVFGVIRISRMLLQVDTLMLGCFPAAGAWDLLVTNPDGETATFASAIVLDSCPLQPFAIDSVSFAPATMLTCPSTDENNPTSELTVDIFGSNLPPDFSSPSFDSRVSVNLVGAEDGSPWQSMFTTDIELIDTGHYRIRFIIYNGSVNFPVSDPPPGLYRITITGCVQAVASVQTVEIREECLPPPPPP
ncbi:MAG TPA: hypothetical protein VNT79_11595 [Phycisphaerae bacterium]|nr:hypothetical protein [Phycisphaerae bacterium]